MTLDEAIRYEEKIAEEHDKIRCIKTVTLEECKRAEEHRQIAEWLRELKQYKEQDKPQGELEAIWKEIANKYCGCDICDIDKPGHHIVVGSIDNILDIIDKAKGE